MKMKASDLNGMTVVSLQEGAKLGQVDQPLFDLSARRLSALHVKGDSGISVLPFDQIEKIGSDAITITTSQVTQTPGADSVGEKLLDMQALRKLKIVDQDGTFLGTLSEIEFDPQSGQVTQLLAHKGGVMGMGGSTTPIDAAAALTVGVELLTVNANVADSNEARTSAASSSATTADVTGTNKAQPRAAKTDAVDRNATQSDETTEVDRATRPPLSPNDPWSDSESELPVRH
jgi:uncharacterized protein YrrD